MPSSSHDAGLGCVPPDFVLSRTLDQMTKLRGVAAEKSTLVESVVRRTKENKIAGDWGEQATKIVTEKVYPALDRQIARMKGLQKTATHDAGVWKLPKGDEYYHDSLIQWTTSTKGPGGNSQDRARCGGPV